MARMYEMPTAPRTFRRTERKREVEEARGTKQQRGYGGEWERISRAVRQARPVCEICNDAPSVDVDHIQPFNGRNDPLRVDWDNLQAVCRACHNEKTRQGR